MLAMVMVFSSLALGQDIIYPRRELANESVGLVYASSGRHTLQGSGTVAYDPRLIFSCAHILYKQGRWATDYTFYRAWHNRRAPNTGGSTPRGYLASAIYGRVVEDHGKASANAYSMDVSVFYGNRSFGPDAPVLENSGQALRSQRVKEIIGYPAVLRFNGAEGYHFQHTTGLFLTSGEKLRYGYHAFEGVTSGPGSSGGGLFMMNRNTGKYHLAGILVSGNDSSVGVLAMNDLSQGFAVEALTLVPNRRMAANINSIPLPENASVTRILRMEDGSGRIETAELDVEIKDASGNAPLIYLQSPAGRIHRIAMSANQSSIRRLNIGRALYGSKSEGDWLLRIRTDDKSTAVFVRAALHFTTRSLK